MRKPDYFALSYKPLTSGEIRAQRTLERAQQILKACSGTSGATTDRPVSYDSAEDELNAYMQELAKAPKYNC